MNGNMIYFPGLGLVFGPPHIAFSIFGWSVYWYGIILATAVLVAMLYCIHRAPKFGITGDVLLNVVIFAVPFAIIGARTYYVIFEWDRYASDIISALHIRDGGIAIYGAIIGAVVTVLTVAHIKKISAAAVLDIGSLGLLIGSSLRVSQLLGYISCFIAIIILFYNSFFKYHNPAKLIDLTATMPRSETADAAVDKVSDICSFVFDKNV